MVRLHTCHTCSSADGLHTLRGLYDARTFLDCANYASIAFHQTDVSENSKKCESGMNGPVVSNGVQDPHAFRRRIRSPVHA
eukprot:359919-Chlamydomonas_euryale.AAC.6